MLKDNNTPLLIDFGVAHEMVQGVYTKQFTTGGKDTVGTLPWMPPELVRYQVEGLSSNERVNYTLKGDIWMLGMTIYVSLYYSSKFSLLDS